MCWFAILGFVFSLLACVGSAVCVGLLLKLGAAIDECQRELQEDGWLP